MDVNNNNALTRHAGNITVATLVSRIMGYLRDALVAYIFGASIVSDAFYAAYRIANLFRRLFGEGSFSAAFIPVFSEYHDRDDASAQRFVRVMTGSLLCVIVTLTVAGIAGAPFLVRLLAAGFRDDPAQMQLAIRLTQIMFPYFLFISLAALVMGVLQTHRVFFIPALAPVSLSIAEIGYIMVFVPIILGGAETSTIAAGLAVSVLAGGLGQLLFQLPSFLRRGYRMRPAVDLSHPGPRKVFGLMMPAIMGSSVDQVNMFINATILASFLPRGSLTALYYADRLVQLPLALFGIAVAAVALPLMSKSAACRNMQEMKETLRFSARMIGFLVIPAITGLIVIGLPVIRLLFERGAFNDTASIMTYKALVPMAVGITGYSFVKLFANAFFAMHDTRKPVMIACFCMAINVVISLLLMRPFGIAGIASGSAAAGIINALLLVYYLRKKIGPIGGGCIIRAAGKVLAASLLMAAAVAISMRLLAGMHRGLQVAVCILVGCIVYGAAAVIFRIDERTHLMAYMRGR